MALAREGAAQQCSFGQFYQHQQKLRESSVAKAKGVYCSGKDCYSPFPSQWKLQLRESLSTLSCASLGYEIDPDKMLSTPFYLATLGFYALLGSWRFLVVFWNFSRSILFHEYLFNHCFCGGRRARTS